MLGIVDVPHMSEELIVCLHCPGERSGGQIGTVQCESNGGVLSRLMGKSTDHAREMPLVAIECTCG